MFDDFAIKRGSMELLSAWSAIEIASWDIIGKIAGLPVYNLLGGASRERVRVYANGWAGRSTIEDGVERGRKIKAMGFTAAKFDPFPGPWRTHVDRKDEDFAIDYVAAMREALGPDFEILVEAHRRFSPQHAIRIGRRLEELGIEWYEEPCLADNLSLLAEVRDKVTIPIVTGEALYTKESFFECLSRRAADILNPDICAIGGISALMDIAVMAQPQAVVMSPHNYNSPLVGMAATVHVSAVIPNFKITEYFVNFEERLPRHRHHRADAQRRLDRSADRARARHRHRYRQTARPPAPRSHRNTASASTGRNTRARATNRRWRGCRFAVRPHPVRAMTTVKEEEGHAETGRKDRADHRRGGRTGGRRRGAVRARRARRSMLTDIDAAAGEAPGGAAARGRRPGAASAPTTSPTRRQWQARGRRRR